eukprot:scaffold5541_cov161-Isochrysis_galbana.AAC.1
MCTPPIAYCSPFPSPPFLSLYSLGLLPYWAHGWPSALPRAACCVGAGRHDCEIVPPSAIAQSMRHLQAAAAPPHPLAGLPKSSAHTAALCEDVRDGAQVPGTQRMHAASGARRECLRADPPAARGGAHISNTQRSTIKGKTSEWDS